MTKTLIFVAGTLFGIAIAPQLAESPARDWMHDLFKRFVKAGIALGHQVNTWQEELSEEIEDAAHEASVERAVGRETRPTVETH